METNHLQDARISDFVAEVIELTRGESAHFDRCGLCQLRLREAVRRRVAEAKEARKRNTLLRAGISK